MEDVAEFKCQIKLDEKKKNKKYNNKHQIIQIMLCNRIILYFYILFLILYNVIGQYLTIKKNIYKI